MIYKKIKKILKNEGIIGIKKRILNKLYIKMFLYEIDLNFFKEINLNNNNYQLLKIDENILKKIKNIDEISARKSQILKDRVLNYKETLNYVVINKQKEIMGYFCLALKNTKKNPYIHRQLEISENTSYLFDDYTFLNYRQKGVHYFSVKKRLEISSKKGYKKSRVMIYCSNIPSQKTYEKLGFKKIRYLYDIKFFGKKFLVRRKLKNGDM